MAPVETFTLMIFFCCKLFPEFQIWEGRPVRVYETGDFDLVDGNFSPDGTSIVVSDEVGQIYLLATGQGESQKDAKYDQFFLGDFRPLVRDASGNVLDQETQMDPHQRNIQDLLCDPNMIPYQEPYQSMYQQRRLGALGIDWQPPCVNLAVGTMDDATYMGFGENPFAMNPFVGGSQRDLDRHALDGTSRWVEQPTDDDVAMDWEQEAARLSDDSGSDYNASEESLSDVDDEASGSFNEGSTNSEEEFSSKEENIQETHLRRSNRNKRKAEGMVSGKRVRRRQVDSQETGEATAVVLDKRLAKWRQSKDPQSPPLALRSVQQLSTRPTRLAAKNALRFFSNISTPEEEGEDAYASSAHDRCSESTERIPEAQRSIQGSRQEDGPDEGEILEKDVSSKLEVSEVGEVSRRPRSHRRLMLKLRKTGASAFEFNSKGSREDPADGLPVVEQPVPGTEGSEVMAPNSCEDRNQKTLRRLVIRPPRPAQPLHEDLGEFSDTGDNSDDSNGVGNATVSLKMSPWDEVQSSEACRRSPSEEKRKWDYNEVHATKRARNVKGGGAVEPLDRIQDGLSCSSDGSTSNYEELPDASGSSMWTTFGGTVLRSRSNDGKNGDPGGTARDLGLSSSKVLVKGMDSPHSEEREHSGKLFLEPVADLKALQSSVTRTKCMESRGLGGLLSEVDKEAHGKNGISTRSRTSGRRNIMESHKGPLSSQTVEIKLANISKEIRSGVEGRQKQEGVEHISGPIRELHNCNSSTDMINNFGHAIGETNGKRICDRSSHLRKPFDKLEDYESGFSQPYDKGEEDSHFHRKNQPKKTIICTRESLKKNMEVMGPDEEDCDSIERDNPNGIGPAAFEDEDDIRQKVTPGHLQSEENNAWSVSGTEEESNEEHRQNLRHKRRTLGELHPHPILGSTSGFIKNANEDLMCKKRIRRMRSVMSESGRDVTPKRSRERRVPVGKGRETPESSSRRKNTLMDHIPLRDSADRGRWQLRQKAEINNEYTKNNEMEADLESNRMQAVDLHGVGEIATSTMNERNGRRVSTRVRRELSRRDMPCNRDPGRLSEMNLASRDKCVRTRKNSAWLMFSEVEEGTRYIPQYGDEVVYLRQGHEEYLESQQTDEMVPWMTYRNSIRAVEFCRVVELDYAILCESGDTCCKLTLEFTDQTSKVFCKRFRLNLPELTNFPDFIVERRRYDAAIQKNWTSRDRCQVWWRSEDGKGGSWWDGRVISVKPKSSEFPDSPWERFIVQYRSDTSKPQTHSPWELFDSQDAKWEPPCIEEDKREQLSSMLEECTDEPEDIFGLRRFRLLSSRSDFINRVPLPLTMEIVKLRLEKNYYRSVEAFSFDLHLLVSNAIRYFGFDSEIALKLQRLAELLVGDSFLLDSPNSA